MCKLRNRTQWRKSLFVVNSAVCHRFASPPHIGKRLFFSR
nr:MAG TPA: hypothetical protein [Caudoviricetes sp.]